MRMNTLKTIAFMAVALPSLSATAFSATNFSQAPANASTIAVNQCPAGTYFEPAGYVGSGKWRDAHCATGNGHE
jgi:hypothetical protein